MEQRGVTLIELVICLAVLGILASTAIPTLGQSLAKQELESSSLQLAADLRWLQQVSVNAGRDTAPSILRFNYNEPCGYYVTTNTQVIKSYTFPASVRLPDPYSPIGFGLSGAPSGAQTIMLHSNKLNTNKYVILAPVTGRVRISNALPGQPEQ